MSRPRMSEASWRIRVHPLHCRRRSTYPFSDGTHYRVLDDVEGSIDIFACMHRSDGGAEAELILRHDRVIDGRHEQATPAHLVPEVIQKFAIRPNHDRHEKAARAAGVHADFV